MSIFIFGSFPIIVERYYAPGIYPYLSSTLRYSSSLFPFAIGDFIYLALIVYVLYKIVAFARKFKQKKLNKSHRFQIPLQVLNFFLILFIIFKIVWGLNYSRPMINEQLKIGDDKYNTKQLVSLANLFITKTNVLKLAQAKVPHYSIDELEKKSADAYNFMAKQNTVFTYKNPCLKSVLNSWIISKVGIEGYYAPLTGEANMNMLLPDFVKPYVSCHEIAHQLGIAYEDEANLLGYLTAVNSPDLHYQYSANYEMLRYILFEVRMKSPDEYQKLYDKLDPGVIADFKTEKEFWRKYNGQMFGYMDATFDRFLKLNNQKKGIDSYQDIVIWLWNIYKSEV
ncbi:DUF3810 domain-containing protein [Pedobacter sp. AW1-32]|uniref:DUF3810 domain-containing protein n=1 Tax=Pedobacter sp. AW1-32 TaxID=3383026 RepID=UPI003FF14324